MGANDSLRREKGTGNRKQIQGGGGIGYFAKQSQEVICYQQKFSTEAKSQIYVSGEPFPLPWRLLGWAGPLADSAADVIFCI